MGYTNTGKNKSLQRCFIELKIIPCLYYISCSFKPVWMGIYRSRRLRTGRWQFLACIYSNFSIRLCLLLGRRKYIWSGLKGKKAWMLKILPNDLISISYRFSGYILGFEVTLQLDNLYSILSGALLFKSTTWPTFT